MRLTLADRGYRLMCENHFGQGAIVRLFGSRTDDRLRGGDIDLHIQAETSEMTMSIASASNVST